MRIRISEGIVTKLSKNFSSFLKEDEELLYRGINSGKIYKNPNKGAIFFSLNKEYASDYGNEIIITKMPPRDEIFDVRKDNHRLMLVNWINKKINSIDPYELPTASKIYFNDSVKYVKEEDNPKKILSALINLVIAIKGGLQNYTTGEAEKMFMEENGLDYMYVFEFGFTQNKPNSEWSVAFRDMPPTKTDFAVQP